MPSSILEAIKLGFWDFEPPEVECGNYDATDAMPGTKAKLEVMAARVQAGLPIWHPSDRDDMESDPPPDLHPVRVKPR